MGKELFKIPNGNCNVTLYNDGTRIVETLDPNATEIILDLPLSLDINISNRCSNGCPYCYAGNTPEGNVANLLDMDYLNDISGIEIAINIQFPLPDHFEAWLEKMKKQDIIVNGTINQIDLEREPQLINWLHDLHGNGLLHGIGISYRKYNEILYNNIRSSLGDDIVIHTIIGVTPISDVIKLLDEGFKVLILGYKQKNRGIDYFSQVNIDNWVKDIKLVINHPFSSVIAFDTAGLKQAKIQDILTKEQWDNSYQGDEGTISFYIDAVNRTFNIDSHTNKTPYNIGDKNLKEMFKIIKNVSKGDDVNEENKK